MYEKGKSDHIFGIFGGKITMRIALYTASYVPKQLTNSESKCMKKVYEKDKSDHIFKSGIFGGKITMRIALYTASYVPEQLTNSESNYLSCLA